MIQALYQAYLGELFGIRFFQIFEQQATDAKTKRKWQLLIALEERTAALLREYLEARGTTCPQTHQEMEDKALVQATSWQHLCWNELMEALAPWIAGYTNHYRELASQYQAPVMLMVAEHEQAILSFVQLELKQAPSLNPLIEFLERYPANSQHLSGELLSELSSSVTSSPSLKKV
ncbi:hypothetical protein [Dongshaea marina]|uniref:hypothetical protein n=1 Tax=Dongshaea marina TaxID=2047966 RepID=UPI000D3EA4D5|nr:hypothetical protein [Dongshaea marina]